MFGRLKITLSCLRFFWPAILWGLFIFLIISLPGRSIPETGLHEIPQFDKLVHFALFAVLAWLLCIGFVRESKHSGLKNNHLIVCLLTGIIYGALTEWLQFCCFPDRHGSFLDFLANGFGTVFGVVLYRILHRKR